MGLVLFEDPVPVFYSFVRIDNDPCFGGEEPNLTFFTDAVAPGLCLTVVAVSRFSGDLFFWTILAVVFFSEAAVLFSLGRDRNMRMAS